MDANLCQQVMRNCCAIQKIQRALSGSCECDVNVISSVPLDVEVINTNPILVQLDQDISFNISLAPTINVSTETPLDVNICGSTPLDVSVTNVVMVSALSPLDVNICNLTLSTTIVGDVSVSLGTTTQNDLTNRDETIGKVMIANHGGVDAFARLRVSNPLTLFDSTLDNNEQPLLWDSSSSGTGVGTYNLNQAAFIMGVAVSGDSYIRQTIKHVSYQPGKSLLMLFSCNMSGVDIGVEKNVGLFDVSNGVIFRVDDNGANFVVRSNTTGSVTEDIANQSVWNIDRLDGSGPSGFTLDLTKVKLFYADMQWLGVGRVRVGFFIEGQYILCHEFTHVNNTTVYMSSASLPARYEIISRGGSGSLVQICTSVISEGGYEPLGVIRSYGTIDDPVLLNRVTTINQNDGIALMAIRLASNVKYATINPRTIEIGVTNNNVFHGYKLLYDCNIVSLGGNSWVSAGNGSIAEVVTSKATNRVTVSGGIIIDEGYISNTSKSVTQTLGSTNLSIGRKLDGSSVIVALVISKISAQDVDAFGSLIWREIF